MSSQSSDVGAYRECLNCLMTVLERTAHLKSVFDSQWAEGVLAEIASLNDAEHHWTRYAFFIDFVGCARLGATDYADRLESALAALFRCAGNQRAVDARLKALAGPRDQFLGAAFEILVVGAFAQAGLLLGYQPQIGRRQADARVRLGPQHALIEARVNLPKVSRRSRSGVVDLCRAAKRWRSRIVKKAKQYGAVQEPVLLLTDLPYNPGDHTAFDVGTWLELFNEQVCETISGVGFAPDPLRPAFQVGLNHNAKYPLRDDAITNLNSVLPAKAYSRPWREDPGIPP
jgi:hypothetical protein